MLSLIRRLFITQAFCVNIRDHAQELTTATTTSSTTTDDRDRRRSRREMLGEPARVCWAPPSPPIHPQNLHRPQPPGRPQRLTHASVRLDQWPCQPSASRARKHRSISTTCTAPIPQPRTTRRSPLRPSRTSTAAPATARSPPVDQEPGRHEQPPAQPSGHFRPF